MTSGTAFHSAAASHAALSLTLADRSTAGSAGHSLHQPTGGSGSDRLTHPKREDRQTAMVNPREKKKLYAIRKFTRVLHT